MARRSAARADRNDEETLGLPTLAALALIAACGTLWATALGPLPGTRLLARAPFLGSAAVAAGWLGAYALLARCYGRVTERLATRAILGRLAVVQLAIVAASVPAAFPSELLLFRAPYMKYLYLLAVAAFASTLLLGAETKALRRAVLARPAGSLAAGAVVSLLCASYAVGAVDMLLHVDGHWESKYQLRQSAFALNVGMLAALYAALTAITCRFSAGLLLGTALYATLGLTNLGKIAYMHAAVQPLDLLYLTELLPQLGSTLGAAGTAALGGGAALLTAALVVCIKRPARSRPGWPFRIAALALALPALLLPSVGQRHDGIRRALAAAGIELKGHDSVLSVRQNGVLLEFLSYLPDLHVAEPPQYSAAAVKKVADRYDWHAPSHNPPARQATLIVYMIESLMDPLTLGRELTADPIPNIRALSHTHSSGRAVVPGRFGESASSEFELLTGMSMSFLPERSVAYKQYVKRGIPSLPCLLQSRGYRTVAIQADPIDFYNRREVYERLCFERTRWLHEDAAAPRAANGKAPADEAIVAAVIEEAAAANTAFVFAFPSSTHHPYNSDAFAGSALDLAESPDAPGRAELKYYVNTLRVADAAVGTLIRHFQAVERDVVIAVLGDHLPPLSSDALSRFYADVEETGAARLLKERSVPLVVWSNFHSHREDLSMSLNFLGPHLLAAAGVESAGFLRFVDHVRRRVSLLSNRIVSAGGMHWSPEAMPAAYRALLDDYRLLQHDALFGEAYLASSLEAIQTAAARGAR